MNDPRLNSVHLDFPRREDFRHAREALLGARGLHTLAVENHEDALAGGNSFLLPLDQSGAVLPNADFWLKDRDGSYPLRVGVNTIGRLPDNDVVIQGPYVSRRHCAILVHIENRCELYDIASKNGTYINGMRLCGPTQLSTGDEIRMCDRQFIFMSKDAPNAQPSHPNTKVED